jgi:hypothetical protein
MNTAGTQPSSHLLHRIAFVRYLYNLGADQSRQPEPLASVALLTFHDAAEMFLQIIAEHYDVTAKRPDFLEYWSLLKTKNIDLPSYVAMKRLNTARVSLKHAGILPTHTDVEGFRATVSTFLHEATTVAFGIAFETVSQTLMIKSEQVRQPLDEAESALAAGNLVSALSQAAIAFRLSLREYEERSQRTMSSGGTYNVRDALTNSNKLSRAAMDKALGPGRETIEQMIQNIGEVIGEAIMVVGYNLDFESY